MALARAASKVKADADKHVAAPFVLIEPPGAVDAKEDAATSFYGHCDFEPLQCDARRMVLPMKTVAALLG